MCIYTYVAGIKAGIGDGEIGQSRLQRGNFVPVFT